MESLKTKGEIDENGVLHLDLETGLPGSIVELEITISPEKQKQNNYDFSDLAGKLSFKKHGLEIQREMCEEWE